MEKVTVLKTTNKNKVERVVFKFPELMNSDAEEDIKKEYYELLESERKLQDAREEVRRAENEYNARKERFRAKEPFFTLEFETITKEYITRNSGITIKGHGNDIIGFTNISD